MFTVRPHSISVDTNGADIPSGLSELQLGITATGITATGMQEIPGFYFTYINIVCAPQNSICLMVG